MLSGGGVGSTSGGIKLLRLLVLLRVVQLAVLRAQLPRHAVVQPSLGGRVLESAQVEHALVLTLLYLGLVVLSWLPFLVAGHDPLNALFDVVSAAATVGLSAGVAAPDLAPGLTLVLTLDMLAGRVEVLALLVLLYPGSWYKS
jgi:trk system potassium uptake protein TrkH